jgi:predicted DNA binding CopG/RHH family protein
VQVFGGKAKRSMKKKIVYIDEPINARVIENFLPKPNQLVFKEKKTKVTLTLSQKSIEFFKEVAKEHNASYQAMIRRLLDYYVANQQ